MGNSSEGKRQRLERKAVSSLVWIPGEETAFYMSEVFYVKDEGGLMVWLSTK
jgi:hypothetical protein